MNDGKVIEMKGAQATASEGVRELARELAEMIEREGIRSIAIIAVCHDRTVINAYHTDDTTAAYMLMGALEPMKLRILDEAIMEVQ